MKLKRQYECLKDGKTTHLENSQGEPFCGYGVSDDAPDGLMVPTLSNNVNCPECVKLIKWVKSL